MPEGYIVLSVLYGIVCVGAFYHAASGPDTKGKEFTTATCIAAAQALAAGISGSAFLWLLTAITAVVSLLYVCLIYWAFRSSGLLGRDNHRPWI